MSHFTEPASTTIEETAKILAFAAYRVISPTSSDDDLERMWVSLNDEAREPWLAAARATSGVSSALASHVATTHNLTKGKKDWRDPATYRRDGTLVRLLIEKHDDVHGGDEANPTSDVAVGETWETIGWNNAAHTGGETGWQFAGWDWSQDCWTEGRGKVVGWLPYHTADTAPV